MAWGKPERASWYGGFNLAQSRMEGLNQVRVFISWAWPGIMLGSWRNPLPPDICFSSPTCGAGASQLPVGLRCKQVMGERGRWR